jgi:hypothetical protein
VEGDKLLKSLGQAIKTACPKKLYHQIDTSSREFEVLELRECCDQFDLPSAGKRVALLKRLKTFESSEGRFKRAKKDGPV